MVRLRHNVKSLRYPYAVTAFWAPIVACGGEVTEIDYLDSLVFFILQVCSQNHRDLKGNPGKRGASAFRRGINVTLPVALDNRAFVDIAITEAGVACED